MYQEAPFPAKGLDLRSERNASVLNLLTHRALNVRVRALPGWVRRGGLRRGLSSYTVVAGGGTVQTISVLVQRQATDRLARLMQVPLEVMASELVSAGVYQLAGEVLGN